MIDMPVESSLRERPKEPAHLEPVQFKFPLGPHTTAGWEEAKARIRYAHSLKLIHLEQMEPHTGTCVIVGGAPSVAEFLDEIKGFAKDPFNIVCSVNGAHEWLCKNGLTPRIHPIWEYDLKDVSTALGGPPNKETYYYICSHCHQDVFKDLEGFHRVLYHSYNDPQEYHDLINELFPGQFMVGGGYATMFRMISIAVILGFRKFELYGCDSSIEYGKRYLDGYKTRDHEPVINVWGYNPHTGKKRHFWTQGSLAFQVSQFMEFCKVNQSGLSLRVHGDSLLRYVHQGYYPEQYEPQLKDLI